MSARAVVTAVVAATILLAATGCAGSAIRAQQQAARAEANALQARQEAQRGMEASAAGAARMEEASLLMGKPLQPHSTAASDDVKSLDAILAALYAVISGEAGEARDWKRFESLFFPGVARLAATRVNEDGEVALSWHDPADYRARAEPMFAAQPFYEREAARQVQRYGHIAQVFSTYESATTPDGEPFQRGINSIQAYWDGARWWIITILWDAERDGQPIPEVYLRDDR